MKPTQVKTARGLMARYIVKKRIDTPERLLEFNEGGYAFAPYRSTKELLVFSKSHYAN